MNDLEIELAAQRFGLLSDPTRLRILHLVMERGELAVYEVAVLARTSRFNASAHLNRLAGAGMVARRRQGSTVYYRTDDARLPQICEVMCASLRDRARALAAGA
jgi:DNA-binding transcriptional ArsR family regulator